MNTEDNGMFAVENNPSKTLRETLIAYLRFWPVFLGCFVICVSAGILYSRYTTTKYMATTNFLVKSADIGQKTSDDLIATALSGKKQVNISNEILLIGSSSLMERAVAKNGFNISYFQKTRFLPVEIYKDAPFILAPSKGTNVIINRGFILYLKNLSSTGGAFSFVLNNTTKEAVFKWNEPFTIDNTDFVLKPKGIIHPGKNDYSIKVQSTKEAANELSESLTAVAYDSKTSAIKLSITTQNKYKAEDILNALFKEFNESDIEDRNKLSESTVSFIDDRLLNISGELKGVEGNLETYQGSKQLVDVREQSTQSLANSSDVNKTIKDISIQQGIASMILEYFANPSNTGKLVPSSLGLNDATLASLITQYNDLQLKREREAPLVAPNSTVMQDLNTQIANIKTSILESLTNIGKNLKMQEDNFQQQNNQYKNFLSSLPHNERLLQEIKRKQNITEGLYLYLLQKREEAAISITASNVPHYKQIDPAVGYGPVEPNTKIITFYATLLGLLLAFGLFYLKNILNDKINTVEEISKATSLPVLGDVSHIERKKRQPVAILGRSITGEQFRLIRTNLSFLLKKLENRNKVILVTSSVSGEGKSFASLNLAAVYAMPGKKVALLEFDIRKPSIGVNLNFENNAGITNYLSGEVTDLSALCNSVEEIPNLHIYLSGPIPANPADLLLSDNCRKLFTELREKYDYIVVDSPPVKLVSDAFILGELSDIVVYIIRFGVTVKKQLDFIKTIHQNKKFGPIGILINDIKRKDANKYYEYDASKALT